MNLNPCVRCKIGAVSVGARCNPPAYWNQVKVQCTCGNQTAWMSALHSGKDAADSSIIAAVGAWNDANPLPPKQDAPKPPVQESCGNCRFWQTQHWIDVLPISRFDGKPVVQQDMIQSRCRRNAHYETRFETDWCGEWRAKS